MSPRVETLLDTARSRLVRLTPEQAAHAVTYERALLVDTRPAADRERYGTIPGALVVDRNVLEWRLDPTSPHRLEQADDPRRTVIVFCNEGYASSLAAVSLRDLGLVNATDLIGGFHAWAAAGLPVTGTAPTVP
ncbi:rhodanese-like domain-containing protein [Jiangella alkaliphila]|uniref:Rhodanese-related sulfurtransferase n=1 Tax=Jiangella alkaliphila TaxID=419479 RepID=A0A1H2KSI3_9ACTN|nr:rhodanese-like domain-containing protein [Jiangella alkaliphila]SDU71381.1 Rhodanese-related sulfurtransferase [Jiangella alkaliphila]